MSAPQPRLPLLIPFHQTQTIGAIITMATTARRDWSVNANACRPHHLHVARLACEKRREYKVAAFTKSHLAQVDGGRD